MWKEWGEPFLIAAVIAIFIRSFLLGPYKIPTGSMRMTLLEGDRIFVDKITYRFRPPKRGEIIVFKYPLDSKKDFVKRLIAFSGEEVEIRDGSIFVNGNRLDEPAQISSHYYYNRSDWAYAKEGQKIKVPPGAFFVLGDNSAHSSDSRNWGFVPKHYLVGRAFLIWWPLDRFGFVF
ncbi:MAG: signal peptidase I [Candidatus Omnitrophica bacterium]|nr:signal peptidase I [Candidatus Omnitrophota bacterium]